MDSRWIFSIACDILALVEFAKRRLLIYETRKKNDSGLLYSAGALIGLTAPAYAAQNPFAYMEEQSRQAVESAIKAGTVPPGTTIYDCAYGADKNGVTIVIQYRDKNGNWIDVTTGKTVDNKPAAPAASTNKPTEKQLAEYALEVFRLVNKERREAGLDEVVWDDDFATCARIRAEELQHRYSRYRPVEPSAGTTKWPALTNGKAGVYNCTSIADEQGVAYTWIWENIAVDRTTSEAVVKAWMDSKPHKDNILKESHARCGVGVFYTEEASPEGYHWHWVIWFDK